MERLVMLDSGAYTAMTKGVEIDLDAYADFIKQYGHIFTGGCINLDVIGDGKRSYQNWKTIQRKGVNVIPVYHPGSDEKWLEKYLEQTDYLAIGAIANMDTKKRIANLTYLWKKYLLDDKGKPKLKVHGLGLTSLRVITSFPWYSVDSAMTMKNAGYGSVIVPRLANIKPNDGSVIYECDMHSPVRLVVSHWRARAVPKSVTMYHSLPKLVRRAYDQYFRDRGYYVGTAVGTRRPLTKREKKQLKEIGQPAGRYPTIFGEEAVQEEGDQSDSLMKSHRQRIRCNLDFWLEFTKLPSSPIVYQVVTSIDHLRLVSEKGLPFLVSYYMLAGGHGRFFEMVINATRG